MEDSRPDKDEEDDYYKEHPSDQPTPLLQHFDNLDKFKYPHQTQTQTHFVDFSKTPYLNDNDNQVIDTKAYIVHEILNSGEQRLPKQLLDEVKIRVTGENIITMYFRDFKIADYVVVLE